MNKPYRFELDKALATWRRNLQYNRAFSADDLDELAQHLRDQVEGLMKQGLSEEAAFREALRRHVGDGVPEGLLGQTETAASTST